MNVYAKNEIVSSTTLGRSIGIYLEKLRNKEMNKVAVIRNNNLEAILLPIDEYERISEISEHIELAAIIHKRDTTALDNSVKFDDILREQGINANDL